jgi:hypothetical protein
MRTGKREEERCKYSIYADKYNKYEDEERKENKDN